MMRKGAGKSRVASCFSEKTGKQSFNLINPAQERFVSFLDSISSFQAAWDGLLSYR